MHGYHIVEACGPDDALIGASPDRERIVLVVGVAVQTRIEPLVEIGPGAVETHREVGPDTGVQRGGLPQPLAVVGVQRFQHYGVAQQRAGRRKGPPFEPVHVTFLRVKEVTRAARNAVMSWRPLSGWPTSG